MNSDSSHQAAVAAVQSFRRSHGSLGGHGQVSMEDHPQVNPATRPLPQPVLTGNHHGGKKFSPSPMGQMPPTAAVAAAHDMNKFYMSSLLNLNQTQTSKENASASNLQGMWCFLYCNVIVSKCKSVVVEAV